METIFRTGNFSLSNECDWNWTTDHDKSIKRTLNVLKFCEIPLCPRILINIIKQSYLTWGKGMDTKLHPIDE